MMKRLAVFFLALAAGAPLASAAETEFFSGLSGLRAPVPAGTAPASEVLPAGIPEPGRALPARGPHHEASFYCLNGYLHGPDGLREWSGDSNACSDPDKVLIGRRFACFNGYLFGPNNIRKWSGDSEVCGKPEKIKLGRNLACLNGYIIDAAGNEEWTGDSEYCGSHDIP